MKVGWEMDKDSNQLIITRADGTRKWPLADVQAVQTVCNPSLRGRPGYQVLLVLRDAGQPRLRIGDTHERADVEVFAQQVATFLNVPFLDHTRVNEGFRSADDAGE
jgi:hypothetical protein